MLLHKTDICTTLYIRGSDVVFNVRDILLKI